MKMLAIVEMKKLWKISTLTLGTKILLISIENVTRKIIAIAKVP